MTETAPLSISVPDNEEITAVQLSDPHHQTTEKPTETPSHETVATIKPEKPEHPLAREKVIATLKEIAERMKTIVHRESHDNTGAIIAEGFHSQIGENMRERSYKQDSETGFIEVLKSDEQPNYIYFIQNGLAVANKHSHGAGDAQLIGFAQAAGDVLGSRADTALFHLNAGNFAVIAETSDEAKTFVDSAKRSFDVQIGMAPDSLVPARVAVCSISRAEALRMFNNMQVELKNNGLGPLDFHGDDKKAERFVTNLMLRALELQSEYLLLKTYVDTVREAQNSSPEYLESAKKLWEGYGNKFFEEPPLSFDQVINSDEDEYQQINARAFERSVKRVMDSWTIGNVHDKTIDAAVAEAASTVVVSKSVEILSIAQVAIGKKEEQQKTSERKAIEISLLSPTLVEGQMSLEDTLVAFTTPQMERCAEIEKVRDILETNPKDLSLENLKILMNQVFREGVLGNTLEVYSEHLKACVELLEKDYYEGAQQTEVMDLLLEIAKTTARAHNNKYDTLTGLPRREEFYRRSTEALTEALLADKDFAMLFGDVGNLKGTNELLGRKSGNLLLKSVSKAFNVGKEHVQNLARVIDTRYGGDEFAALVIFDNKGEPQKKGSAPADIQLHNQVKGYISDKSIPLSSDARAYAQPLEIQLGLGSCTKAFTFEVMQKLLDAEGALSTEDAKIINEVRANLSEYAQKYKSEALSEEDTAKLKFFVSFVDKLMLRISDRFVEYSKGSEKMLLLREKYKLLVAGGIDINDADPEAHFLRELYSFSRKSLGGESFEAFIKYCNEKGLDVPIDSASYNEFVSGNVLEGTADLTNEGIMERVSKMVVETFVRDREGILSIRPK